MPFERGRITIELFNKADDMLVKPSISTSQNLLLVLSLIAKPFKMKTSKQQSIFQHFCLSLVLSLCLALFFSINNVQANVITPPSLHEYEWEVAVLDHDYEKPGSTIEKKADPIMGPDKTFSPRNRKVKEPQKMSKQEMYNASVFLYHTSMAINKYVEKELEKETL